MDLLKVHGAASELGVSYPTIKRWIYDRKIKTTVTASGHPRIPRDDIDRLSFYGEAGKGPRKNPPPDLKLPRGLEQFISARDQLAGRATKVEIVGFIAKLALGIGGQTITANITRDACRDLGLKKGQPAAALIKATGVTIIAGAKAT